MQLVSYALNGLCFIQSHPVNFNFLKSIYDAFNFSRPEPIMLFKLPIMFLSKLMLQNFIYYAPVMLYCAQLCSIMLHKLLLYLSLQINPFL